MANTYTTGLKLVKPGLNDPGWGTTVNDRLTDLVDQAVVGSVDVAVTSGGTTTLPTIADGTSSDARNMTLVITGSLTSVQTATVRVPATVTGIAKLYSVINSAGGTVTVETSGGASVAVPDGRSMLLRVTSAGVYEAVNYSASFTVGSTLFAPKFAPTGGTATGNGMYLPATNTLAWSTNGVEGMRLDSSGNLGVGTNSPASILHLNSSANAFATIQGGSGVAGIDFLTGAGTNRIISGLSGTANIGFYTASTERMRLDASGKVGIGTVNPGEQLSVVSGTSKCISSTSVVPGSPATLDDQEFSSFSATAAVSGLTYSGTDPRLLAATVTPTNEIVWRAANIGLLSSGYLTLSTNSTERARITSTGLVGIGTSSPAASLDVNGGVRAIQGLPTNDNSNVGFSFGPDGDTGIFSPTTGGAASGKLVFYGNAVEVARFDSGNLGLGVTPSAWSGVVAMQLPTGAALTGFSNTTNLAQNAYFNGSWRYISTAAAALAQVTQGQHIWFTAPSGTAGNAISFTQAMTLDASSNLSVTGSVSAASMSLTTALPATSGGTGQSSYAVGDLLYANTTTTLAKLADVATGNVLRSGGVGVAPAWGKVGLTTDVTGTLPVANGGTGQTTANAALNALLPSQTSNNNKFLQTDGTNTSWATVDILGTIAAASAGAVGTYALMIPAVTTSFAVGDQTAGSNLRFGGTYTDSSGNTGPVIGSAPSGNWRAMGPTNGGYSFTITLWLRYV